MASELSYLIILLLSISVDSKETCNPVTCQPPKCKCGGTEIPGGLSLKETPQIVLLTFDDALFDDTHFYFGQLGLIDSSRLNPNGCPVGATFFVSHRWTDYRLAEEYFLKGHEIAVHSIT